MASIKERAAALNLAEKLCVRPQAHGAASKPVQSSCIWSSLISHLKSSVKVKRRRIHLKSHSDCFLGSEAVDVVAEHLSSAKGFEGVNVSRDKVACVCQALLDCNVFEAVGTKVFAKDVKQNTFQDSKSALYRFLSVCAPSVEDLEKGALGNGIQKLFCSPLSDRQDQQTCPGGSHVQMFTPVMLTQTAGTRDHLDLPLAAGPSSEPVVDGLSPSRAQTDVGLPQSLVDGVWREQTLLSLLDLVELPLLEGLLQGNQSSSPPPRLSHSNPDLIYSSNHLDRQILKAFRDSQEDEWLCAGLDCLDFLPDQPVVELSRELPNCFLDHRPSDGNSQDGGVSSDDPPRLSRSGLDQCKLLLYRTLVKHYHTDRPPLMPQHMADVYTAITDLLASAKLSTALQALQLCLKLLPPACRDELHRLLSFMALAGDPKGLKLDKEVENRLAVKRTFSRAILHSKSLSKDREDLLVVFMLSNIKDIFRIPGALLKGVSNKLASLAQDEPPDVTGSTFCKQVSDSTKNTTNQELWVLLNNIYLDTKRSSKEKKRLLRQFHQAHPEIFDQYFGESALGVL